MENRMFPQPDESFTAYAHRLSEALGGLEILGSGRTRITFALGPREVFKVGHCEEGIIDNETEAQRYETGSLGFPVAECYLQTINGIDGLVMERVEPIAEEDCPPWAYFVDSMQVGLNPWDQIVAFDFGLF